MDMDIFGYTVNTCCFVFQSEECESKSWNKSCVPMILGSWKLQGLLNKNKRNIIKYKGIFVNTFYAILAITGNQPSKYKHSY